SRRTNARTWSRTYPKSSADTAVSPMPTSSPAAVLPVYLRWRRDDDEPALGRVLATAQELLATVVPWSGSASDPRPPRGARRGAAAGAHPGGRSARRLR